jgi:hypothetical protein
MGGPENSDGSPNLYAFLKKNKDAFKECSFLLPGLKAALLEAPSGVKKEGGDETPKRHTRTAYGEPFPHDTATVYPGNSRRILRSRLLPVRKKMKN